MKTLEELKAALAVLLSDGALRKLVLSRPSDPSILRSEGHLFEKQGELYLQIETFHADGKATHANFPASLAADAVWEQLESYSQLNLLSPRGDAEARRSKKGKWLIGGRISDSTAAPVAAVRAHDHKKQYLLQEGEPYPFLIRLGICAPDGRVLEKKKPKFLQINRFLENLEAVYDRLPAEGELFVLDLCCGKSYLTFAVYHYLTVVKERQVRMLGADLKRDVIAYCSDLALKLGYASLSFVCCDIGDLTLPRRPDLVLSLHACDIATDIVLAKAMVSEASVILSTPCCHHELMGQISAAASPMTEALSPLIQHSLLRQKLADALTDALRAKMLQAEGYEVTVTELIDPEQTPKNLLIRAVRKSVSAEKRKQYLSEYEELCRYGGLSPYLKQILARYRAGKDE